jgi:hypothetical protein
MNQNVAKNPISRNILRRFAPNRPENACAPESGFVNHCSVACRIKVSQGVNHGRRYGVPT